MAAIGPAIDSRPSLSEGAAVVLVSTKVLNGPKRMEVRPSIGRLQALSLDQTGSNSSCRSVAYAAEAEGRVVGDGESQRRIAPILAG